MTSACDALASIFHTSLQAMKYWDAAAIAAKR